jgi:hypothetical protein
MGIPMPIIGEIPTSPYFLESESFAFRSNGGAQKAQPSLGKASVLTRQAMKSAADLKNFSTLPDISLAEEHFPTSKVSVDRAEPYGFMSIGFDSMIETFFSVRESFDSATKTVVSAVEILVSATETFVSGTETFAFVIEMFVFVIEMFVFMTETFVFVTETFVSVTT